MARKKVIWTQSARSELLSVLIYFNERNGNKRYSKKIFREIQKILLLISKHPFLGKLTDIENVRVIVYRDYLLFYKLENNVLLVISFWDSRQDPKSQVNPKT